MFNAQRIEQKWLMTEEDILHREFLDVNTGEEFHLEERLDFEFEGVPVNIIQDSDGCQDLSGSISSVSYDSVSNSVSFDVIINENSSYYSGFALLFTDEEIEHIMSNVEDMDFFFKVEVPGTSWFICSYGHID